VVAVAVQDLVAAVALEVLKQLVVFLYLSQHRMP
jgi:hypothetical protein